MFNREYVFLQNGKALFSGTIVRAVNAECVELRITEKELLFIIPVIELRYDPVINSGYVIGEITPEGKDQLIQERLYMGTLS